MNHRISLRALTVLAVLLGHVPSVIAQENLPPDTADQAPPPEDRTLIPQVGPAEVLPPSPQLGGAGESCRARADCEAGLRCLANVCRDPLEGTTCSSAAECGPHLRCVQQVCQSPSNPVVTLPEPDDLEDGDDPYVGLLGTRGFIGGSLMAGPVLGSSYALLAAVRGGLYVHRHEIAIEITPFSSVYGLAVPIFQANASYGYLYPMHQLGNLALYWPVRIGVGFMLGTGDSNVYVEARADVVGLALQIDQLVLDFHVPSFRFAWGPAGGGLLFHWFFGVSASYVI